MSCLVRGVWVQPPRDEEQRDEAVYVWRIHTSLALNLFWGSPVLCTKCLSSLYHVFGHYLLYCLHIFYLSVICLYVLCLTVMSPRLVLRACSFVRCASPLGARCRCTFGSRSTRLLLPPSARVARRSSTQRNPPQSSRRRVPLLCTGTPTCIRHRRRRPPRRGPEFRTRISPLC